jgi:hypothetical protein
MDRWYSLDLVLRYRGANSVKRWFDPYQNFIESPTLLSLSKGILFCLNQFSIKGLFGLLHLKRKAFQSAILIAHGFLWHFYTLHSVIVVYNAVLSCNMR